MNLSGKKLAIVFDIDDTSISNFKYIKENDMGGTIKYYKYIVRLSHDPIKPTRDFYNFARNNNIAIFFITGRNESSRSVTTYNLKLAGYPSWQHLYMRPNNLVGSAVPFKTSVRKKLTQKGYEIVLNIGDLESDLIGGYSDMTVKIPNPFYLIS